jgi:hypothetical protein
MLRRLNDDADDDTASHQQRKLRLYRELCGHPIYGVSPDFRYNYGQVDRDFRLAL